MLRLLKALISAVLFMAISAQASMSCLGSIPSSVEELNHRIRVTQSNLQSAIEAEQSLKELADDALRTRNVSKTVMSASLILLTSAYLWPLGTKMLRHEAAGLIGFGTLWLTVGVDVALLVDYVSSLRWLSDKEKNKLVSEITAAAQQQTCSYAQSHQFLRQQRDLLFQGPLNGSIWHTIEDHITLGSLSQKATQHLYLLSVAERTLLQRELADLKALMPVISRK